MIENHLHGRGQKPLMTNGRPVNHILPNETPPGGNLGKDTSVKTKKQISALKAARTRERKAQDHSKTLSIAEKLAELVLVREKRSKDYPGLMSLVPSQNESGLTIGTNYAPVNVFHIHMTPGATVVFGGVPNGTATIIPQDHSKVEPENVTPPPADSANGHESNGVHVHNSTVNGHGPESNDFHPKDVTGKRETSTEPITRDDSIILEIKRQISTLTLSYRKRFGIELGSFIDSHPQILTNALKAHVKGLDRLVLVVGNPGLSLRKVMEASAALYPLKTSFGESFEKIYSELYEREQKVGYGYWTTDAQAPLAEFPDYKPETLQAIIDARNATDSESLFEYMLHQGIYRDAASDATVKKYLDGETATIFPSSPSSPNHIFSARMFKGALLIATSLASATDRFNIIRPVSRFSF